jgi:hypothetical protein
MTLYDLYNQLTPEFPVSTQKDVKTAVSVLAKALNTPDAKSCPLTLCLSPRSELYHLVETHLIAQHKSSHTIRNTKNNLSRLFRLAESRGLFSLQPEVPKRRFSVNRQPRRGELSSPVDGSSLRRARWPIDLEEAFARFSKWATDPLVENRSVALRKRQITIQSYQQTFECYFGYLHHILHIHPVKYDHLFELSLIQSYVNWHINEKHKRPTVMIHTFLKNLLALINQYHKDSTLLEKLIAFKRSVPRAVPFYNKANVWLPLDEQRRIAIALWPQKPPTAFVGKGHGQTGRYTASTAGVALMFRLWTYIPLRQRNMREMKLGTNLYKTPEGVWHLRFIGDELKISRKRGTINEFKVPFPSALVPWLEEYLMRWRPLLLGGKDLPYVFLNDEGRAHTGPALNALTSRHVYAFTGKTWHPHLVRTVWATEWIRDGGDFVTAAIMLNDRLETVIKSYSHLLDENVAEKAYQWVQTRMNGHSSLS